MNISKKAIMSFIVALISVVSMAQPYYHIMKEENGKLTEETGYDSKDYKIKIDMDKPKPKDAIGGMITIESYDCDMSPLKRSFYFTNKGNVYYSYVYDKFFFENEQFTTNYRYIGGTYKYTMDLSGYFYYADAIEECINPDNTTKRYHDHTETYFYFANPKNLGRLQENYGNEKWAVLSACEWDYVCRYLGEYGWTVGEYRCFLIDTTPGKSLFEDIRSKKGSSKSLSVKEFREYEPQGLVALPVTGYRSGRNIKQDGAGRYWSCTSYRNNQAYYMTFTQSSAGLTLDYNYGNAYGYSVRLVILVDD